MTETYEHYVSLSEERTQVGAGSAAAAGHAAWGDFSNSGSAAQLLNPCARDSEQILEL